MGKTHVPWIGAGNSACQQCGESSMLIFPADGGVTPIIVGWEDTKKRAILEETPDGSSLLTPSNIKLIFFSD